MRPLLMPTRNGPNLAPTNMARSPAAVADDAPDLGVRRAGQLGDRPGAVAAGVQPAHQLVAALTQRPQVGGDLRQLVAQLLLQLVTAGACPRLSAGNYDYPLGGGADVSFNPGGDLRQLVIGG